jgi:hexosaminidase
MSRYFLLLILWIQACAPSQVEPSLPPAIIPMPGSMVQHHGSFSLTANTVIRHNACAGDAASFLQEALALHGVDLELEAFEPPLQHARSAGGDGLYQSGNTIQLSCQEREFQQSESDESYQLEIMEGAIHLTASHATGLFRGIQTLLQAFPADLASEKFHDGIPLPCLSVADSPRFPHRGMLLDVCRHFFSPKEVMDYIDLLAFYKMNTLHWHLTEDQGWRIAIDAYPELTEVGAWRTEPDGSRYGGFYSKDDIGEVVAYAQRRHIQIIPEIELPGHAQAALAAYPSLSCTGGPHEVANDWGVFKEIYCAGNDSTFLFLKQVLAEVMALFPSTYIHIGGDEAPKYRWEHCNKCKKRMQEEGLKDTHELQSWFIAEIGSFLKQHGRTMIGWDEISEGGLPPGAVVQSWRGTSGGLDAAKAGHYAIMSPTSHCYFDYGVDQIDLEKVYQFDPIPAGLNPEHSHYILGGEGNLWTEHIPDKAALDRQAFPRLIALAEVLWSTEEVRHFADFEERLLRHYPLLQAKGVRYGSGRTPYRIASRWSGDSLFLVLHAVQTGVGFQVSIDGKPQPPDGTHEWLVPKRGVQTFRIHPFAEALPMGDSQDLAMQAHQAIGAGTSYLNPYSTNYPGSRESALVDGLLGSPRFRDGRWQGFSGVDAEVLLDFGVLRSLSKASIGGLQYNNAWIFLPSEVTFYAATDTASWQLLGTVGPQQQPTQRGEFTERLEVEFALTKARYLKVVARNTGTVPAWHEAAGAQAWMFIDEIILE